MLEETLLKVAQQIPALATLVALVWIFVRYLERRDKTLKDISDNCHKTQENSTLAVREMTTVLGVVRGLLEVSNGAKSISPR